MKKLISILLIAFSTASFGVEKIVLPKEGFTSSESITKCESQVASSKNYIKNVDQKGNGYIQFNPGSDSYIYFFTNAQEPSHPGMIKITIHPMEDPKNPQEKDFEFFGSFAGKEEDFIAWRRRIMFDFGRGFATGVIEESNKSKIE